MIQDIAPHTFNNEYTVSSLPLLHLPLRPPQPPLLSQQTNLLLTKQLRMLFHYL